MKPIRTLIALAALAGVVVLAGCGSSGKKAGGYYKDDGPGSSIPADILNTPNAVPRIEPHARANLRPYRVLGKNYVPLTSDQPFRQTGLASWYGKKFHGRKTANGETYDMYAMTAAHPTLPLPSYARVTRSDTGVSVVVRINDRGPFHGSRIIDLSYTAAAKLGLIRAGSEKVVVEAITHSEIARGQTEPTPTIAAQPEPSLADQLNQTAAADLTEQSLVATARPNTHIASVVQPTNIDMPDALSVLDAQAAAQPANDQNQHLVALPLPTLEGSERSGIFLQFGAFSGQANADSLARQLNQQIAMIEHRPVMVQPTENLYRVQIGPYASRTDAVNAALRIQQHTGTQPTLATRD